MNPRLAGGSMVTVLPANLMRVLVTASSKTVVPPLYNRSGPLPGSTASLKVRTMLAPGAIPVADKAGVDETSVGVGDMSWCNR